MPRSLSSLVVVAALATAGTAFASTLARPSIHVQPTVVAAGGRIHVYGNAGACSSAQLTVISSAFPGHAFGQGSLTGRVRRNHTYSIRGRIRAGAHKGMYSVGARCGGGNLGVSALFRVR